MKKINIYLIVTLLTAILPVSVFSQKNQNSINQIVSSDLEGYVSFLGSPLLKGRMNGEVGLEIAANYIASQAKLIGLRPANGTSYFQPYSVMKKIIDPDKTKIQVISDGKDSVTINDPIFQLVPTGPSDFILDGELVFAGYGIKADKYNYDDFENLDTDGKILLVMDRAPMSDDGKSCQFEESGWISGMNFQMKLTTLLFSKAKAILFVSDPKSGFRSFEESNPGIASYLKSSATLKNDQSEIGNPFMAAMPKVIFINRSVADAIL
jgi:hypothetical protein